MLQVGKCKNIVNKKKIFITGGTGFIGKNIISLLKGNYDIFILSRQISETTSNVKFLKGNIFSNEDIKRILKDIRPNILLHLAWNVKKNYENSRENEMWYIQSCYLLKHFIENGGEKVVSAGTCYEYGLNLLSDCSENYICEPTTLYGKFKLKTCVTFESECKKSGVELSWGRIYFPYGIGEEKRKLISSAILSLKNNEVFYCKFPENVIDYIYIEDVAKSFVYLLKTDKINGIYNISTGRGYRIKDILNIVAKKMNKEKLLNFKKNEYSRYIVGRSRISILNNVYSIEEGIDKMLNYYKCKGEESL